MTLPDVSVGDPHTAAHNDEREEINRLMGLVDDAIVTPLDVPDAQAAFLLKQGPLTNLALRESTVQPSNPKAHAPALGLWFPEVEGAVGNGSTNDYAALQATQDKIFTAGGGVMFLTPGKNYAFDSTLSVAFPGGIRGAARSISKMTYTGSGTALQPYRIGTAEQKVYWRLQDFDLVIQTVSATTIAVNAKGVCYGKIDIGVIGVATGTFLPLGSVGILFDASYGGSIGAWWNYITVYIRGFDTGVKFIGIDGAGQANENYVKDSRIGWTNRGVWIDTGDHVTVQDSDLTSSAVDCIGVYCQDEGARILNCRFETTSTAIKIAGSDGTHTGGRRVVIENNVFASNVVNASAIDINPTVSEGPLIGPNYWASTLSKKVNDNQNPTVNGGLMARYTDRGWVQINFVLPAIAANTTYSDLTLVGGTAAKDIKYFLGRPYQIRGMSARLGGGSPTAGNLTVYPKVGSTADSAFALVINQASGVANKNFQGMGRTTDAGGNGIGCMVTTDAAFAPVSGQTLYVTLWVEFTD